MILDNRRTIKNKKGEKILLVGELEKYSKKPALVGAFRTDEILYIHTLEGAMKVNKGDWVIRGGDGEYYPCKNDVFEKNYEVCEKNNLENKLEKEYKEATERLKDLNNFLDRYEEGSLDFELSDSKFEKLKRQLAIMKSYADVLEQRYYELKA